MYEISSKLKKCRLEKGYSLKELEKLTGISSSSLQRYETSKKCSISTRKIEALAKALDVSVLYLLGKESREVPLDKYSTLMFLLNDYQYDALYDGEKDYFKIIYKGKTICYISGSELKKLLDKTASYFKFELQQLIDEATKNAQQKPSN